MKKFFTLLCMALISAAGFAQDAYDPTEHNVVVRGTKNLCTENWSDDGGPGEAMTYEGGVWKVTLQAKDTKVIEFKIVDTYAGTTSWYGKEGGDANYQFQVTEISDVTITFDPQTLNATYEGPKVIEYDPNRIDFVVVAGSKDLLNDQDWNVEAEENKMTEVDDGYYELVLNNVKAGSYDFKIAANGAWAKQWGGFDGQNVLENNVAAPAQGGANPPNFKIALPKGATYKVTITLDNMDAANPMVTAAWEEAGVAPVEPDVYSVAGTCNGWNQLDESTEMTEVSAGVYSITIPMQAGEQKFKVVLNHDWAVAYPASDYVFELEEDANVTITINMNEDGNITIATAPCTVYFIKVNVQTTKEAVNLYAAETDSWTQLTGAWPGAAMNAMEGGFTYTVKLTKGEKLWLIFNGEGGQTENIEVDGIGMSRTLDFILSDDWSFERGTAIQGIEAAKQNGAIYNLAGQRVEKAVRGIYVINGRKVVK